MENLINQLTSTHDKDAQVKLLQEIGKKLLTEYVIKIGDITIKPLWVEAYYSDTNTGFVDEAVHGNECQKNQYGALYFHHKTDDLRSGVEAFCIWRKTHEPKAKDRMMRYFGIIVLFAVGAGIGSVGAARLAEKTIWISCGLLLVSFALMFIREEIEENPAIEKDLAEIRQETQEIDRTLKQELKEEREELHEELHEKLR